MDGLKTNLQQVDEQKGSELLSANPAAAKRTVRSCFACRKSFEKKDLLRLVVDDEGQIWPDLTAKLPGRGAYLCMLEPCLAKVSDKRLNVLKRDFSPQLPQWQTFQQRLSGMLGVRLQQLMSGMKKRSAIGRDAVMHRMWNKSPMLLLLAADAGDALVRQVQDAVEKRDGRGHGSSSTDILISLLGANDLGLALGREKISVVAFSWDNPVEKFQQFCVWQKTLTLVGADSNKRESKVTDGE
ncbi:MAG: DUF448 domain-containing protein [Ghiorsea sp.]